MSKRTIVVSNCILFPLIVSFISNAHAQSAVAGSAAIEQAAQASQGTGGAVETLNEIIVTAPSPVQRSKPVPRKTGPSKSNSSPGAKASMEIPPAGPEPADATPPANVLLFADDAFASVTVTTASEFEAKQGQTIADTLAKKPGINASTFAPGASRPIVRGLDNYRVRVQENGIGTHDVSALSEDHAVPVDPYAAGQVEVIRGPAALRYGSQAIGGIVSVENDRIPSFVPQGQFSGAILGGWNSVDQGREGAFRATSAANGFAIHADGFKRQSEDYATPRGTVLNSFVDSAGGAGGFSLIGDNGFIGAVFARVDSLYGIPGEEARIDLGQDKLLSRGEWRVRDSGIDAVRFWFGSSDYVHEEVVGEDVGSRFTNREQEGRAELQHQPGGSVFGEWNGAVGIQWAHREIEAKSFEGASLLEPAATASIAAFLYEELAVSGRLRLQLAGRIERTNVDGAGLVDFSDPLNPLRFSGEKSFTPFGLSAGLLYDLWSGSVMRLTGQYVERAPDAAELFSQGLHEATGTFEIGNPDISTEKATTAEIGLKKTAGSLRFDASAYYTHYDGFIAKILTGTGCGDTLDTCGIEDELDQLVFQQRDASFYGMEILAQYDVSPVFKGVWGLEAQYDFVHAQFEEGGNLPRIPPHRVGGGLYYRDAVWLARLGVLHAFEQDRIAENETPTDGYTLVTAELSYTMKEELSDGIASEFTLGIKGENLADDDVRNHASFKKDDVLQPGASVRVFGRIKFN